MKLREYQEDLVKEIQTTSSNVIAALPTGGGKSLIVQQLVVRDKTNKYAVVVRNEPLIAQLIDRLEEVGLEVGVIKAGYKFDITKEYDVYLIMEQTYWSRGIIPTDVDKVIKDEFHIGFNGKQFNHILDSLNPTKVVGLTATPITESGIGIHNVLPDYKLLEGITTQSLIDKGYLSKITYSLPTNSKLSDMLTEELSKVKISSGDYASGELEAVINTEEHNKLVVSEVIDKCLTKGRKTLIFASSIAHVEALAKVFTEEGIDVVYTHSKMKKVDKDVAMELYMTGKVNVMINMSILTTGFDDPATDAVVLLRPTKVLRLYLQIVGRGMRIRKPLDDTLSTVEEYLEYNTKQHKV